MENNSSEQTVAQRIDDAYTRGNTSILVVALTPAQHQQFCRAVIALAHAECARMLPVALARNDTCVSAAIIAAQDWLDQGTWPSDAIQRRFDDFYNPFWLAFGSIAANHYECATAAAYCTERAVQAAYRSDWATTCREVTTVVDVVAQANAMDRVAAIAAAERWYCEVAWALLHTAEPPSWPPRPPISPS
jgi:hypothetical protein